MERAGRGTVSAEHVGVIADALAEHDGTLDLRDVELLVRCARRVASSEADPEALLRIWDHVDSRLRYLLMPAIVEHEKISSTWLADAIVALDQGGFSWTRIPNGPRGTEVVEEVIRQGVSSDLSLRLLEKIRERPEGARVSTLHESFGELVRQRLVELQEPGRALSIDLAEHEFAVVSLLDKLDRSTPQAADEVNSWQGSEWPRARAAAVAAARRMGLDVNTDALIASARTSETRRMILSVFGGDDRIREWTTPAEGSPQARGVPEFVIGSGILLRTCVFMSDVPAEVEEVGFSLVRASSRAVARSRVDAGQSPSSGA